MVDVQRFSELCENLRVSSQQILTSELTGWKPRLCNHCSSYNNISTCTSKHPSFYVTGDSLSPVRFPTCQFYQSKFDVTRPCNFHKVLKTSVHPESIRKSFNLSKWKLKSKQRLRKSHILKLSLRILHLIFSKHLAILQTYRGFQNFVKIWGSRHIKFWHQNWQVGNRAYVIIAVLVTISVDVQVDIPSFYVTGDSLCPVRFPTCQFYQSKVDVRRPCNFHKVLKTSVWER